MVAGEDADALPVEEDLGPVPDLADASGPPRPRLRLRGRVTGGVVAGAPRSVAYSVRPWYWPASSAVTTVSWAAAGPSRSSASHSGSAWRSGTAKLGAGVAVAAGTSALTAACLAITSRNAQYLAVGFPASSSGAS